MTAFLRALDDVDKAAAVAAALPSNSPARFDILPSEMSAVPGCPFAYWVSPELRSIFATLPPVESEERAVKQGLASADDFRFVRVAWEVSATELDRRWRAFAKGGRRSTFYSPISAVVDWGAAGAELRANLNDRGETRSNIRMLKSTERDFFFRPGVTWPLRGIQFSAQAVPAGTIFSNAGKMAFASDPKSLLGLFNSGAFDALIGFFAGKVGGVQYEVGLIRKVPYPLAETHEAMMLADLAHAGWSLTRSLDTVSEVSHALVVPALSQVDGVNFDDRVLAWGERVAGVEAELVRVQSELDELCFELYGISDEDRRAITEGFGVSDSDDDKGGSDDDDESDSEVELDPAGLAAGLVSWAVGVAVGRFDVRLATGEREWPVEPDPFDPLPVCSAGMLTGDDGLPLISPPDGYPIVPSPVLVDDPGHELDLPAWVRAVFEVVFGDKADAWWSDVGAALDARNGAEGWLRRGLFDHHLKTYSKSRRKAPILWPIGTKSGSYRVWLYAHRVTSDTLFRVLGDVVEPKLATEQLRLSDLTQEFGPSPSASQRRTLDAQQTLVDELIELRDELRAVAPLWHPDLNDGIVIVLAPLWRLFAHHRAWSKELRDRWGKLAKGEYDWAQLAMHIWPERVIPKCAEDRSLAIAHDLEDTFWVHEDINPDKWHPRHQPTAPIDQLIADRTNPTVQTARTHPDP